MTAGCRFRKSIKFMNKYYVNKEANKKLKIDNPKI